MSSWAAPYPPWQVSAGCQGTLLSAAPLTRGQVRGWRLAAQSKHSLAVSQSRDQRVRRGSPWRLVVPSPLSPMR